MINLILSNNLMLLYNILLHIVSENYEVFQNFENVQD